MQALAALVVVGIVLCIPIAGLVALVKFLGVLRSIRDLESRLSALDARVAVLARRDKPAASEAATAPALAPSPEPPPPIARPIEPLARPQTAAVVSPPVPARESVREPVPEMLPRPAPQPPAPPVRPARPPAPPPPAAPAFDWESLLGVRGAAWVGGIAVVVSAILFLKFAIDRNLITPELRIALLVFVGVGGLVGAELSLRRGYAVTANAVSGAGIAILYAAFFAAHALYELIPLVPTFALMALVTVVACVVAIRFDAFYTAVLGLLGGFATPVALSTGEDRPIGLFAYILLLNLGLASLALRKRWHGLVMLALAGTFVIELGWFARHLTPQKTMIGLTAFLLFGLLFLLLPLTMREEDGEESESLLRAAAVGGVAPFLFAILIAGNPRFAGEWPLLFGFVGLLLAALSAIALLRSRPSLLVSGALATALTLPLWASQGLSHTNALATSLAATALALLVNLARRVGEGRDQPRFASQRGSFETAGVIAGAGLGLFALVYVGKNLGGELPPFLVLLVGLLVIVLERSREGGFGFVMPMGAVAVGALIQLWFFMATKGSFVLRNLAVPQLFAIALSLAVRVRWRERTADASQGSGPALASIIAICGLFGCLALPALGADPVPLFLALFASLVVLLVTSVRLDWGALVPIALLFAALFPLAWQSSYLGADDVPLLLAIDTLLFVAFLALPFLIPDSVGSRWKESAGPWWAAALAGPAFLLPLRQVVVRGWGDGFIGLVPVAMAALVVAALQGVSQRFRGGRLHLDEVRLRFLALFAAVALGLVAVAIPLQLEKQWITVGWAIEAAAVWWLFGRLPHPGLKAFGAILFAMVGARLMLNPEVLRYHDRGAPIVNWLLYSYGLPAVCCLFGARFLVRAEDSQEGGASANPLAAAASLLGLLLFFALINLEIADFYSPRGGPIALSGTRSYARDLTTSVAWGLYAMTLLVVGVWRKVRELRYLSLAFLLLTVAKVFLYDLANVGGIYRVLSFLGLGVSLILVSLFYQRFVFRKETAS